MLGHNYVNNGNHNIQVRLADTALKGLQEETKDLLFKIITEKLDYVKIEKLKNNNLYAFRLHDTKRAIATILKEEDGSKFFVVIKVLESHKYEILEDIDLTKAIEARSEIQEPLKTLAEVAQVHIDHVINKKIIILNENQNTILSGCDLAGVHIISGVPGSGKTTLAHSLIRKAGDKVLYATSSKRLVESTKKNFEEDIVNSIDEGEGGKDEQKEYFLTYKALYSYP